MKNLEADLIFEVLVIEKHDEKKCLTVILNKLIALCITQERKQITKQFLKEIKKKENIFQKMSDIYKYNINATLTKEELVTK